MRKSLNELFADFSEGRTTRARFEGLIYRYLINNQEKTCLCQWKRDEYEDYVSWFYPRLKRAINSYKDIGASFEAFMNRFLLNSSKEFRVRITSNAITEYSTWSMRIPEMYVREEPPVYTHENTGKLIKELVIDKKGRKNTKRLLALIIKCYYYVSEDFAERIAPLIGIDKKELLEMLSKIRRLRQKRDDAIYNMKERIYCQFYRCMIYERRLSYANENMPIYPKLKQRHEKARQRLDKMRKRIAGIRTDATNQQVADIIGTTKGTVDASLHKLRLKWQSLSKKSDLN